jgi:hypothetical protein
MSAINRTDNDGDAYVFADEDRSEAAHGITAAYNSDGRIVIAEGVISVALVRITHSPTSTINLRVPLHVKHEVAALRKLAEKHEVDFTATFTKQIEEVLKIIRGEIEGLDKKPNAHNGGNANVSAQRDG